MNSEILIYAAFFAWWKDFPNMYITTSDILYASQGIFPPNITEEEKQIAIEKAKEYVEKLCLK